MKVCMEQSATPSKCNWQMAVNTIGSANKLHALLHFALSFSQISRKGSCYLGLCQPHGAFTQDGAARWLSKLAVHISAFICSVIALLSSKRAADSSWYLNYLMNGSILFHWQRCWSRVCVRIFLIVGASRTLPSTPASASSNRYQRFDS